MPGERIIMPFAPTETVGGGILGATTFPRGMGNERPAFDFVEENETWFSL